MQRYTFPKAERLLKRRDFLKVYEHGRKTEGKYLFLYSLRGTATRKLGVSVSSRIGNAVKRNRAKRLIREAYRLTKNQLPNNIHLVISAKAAITRLRYQDVAADLLAVYSETGLINK